MIVTFFVVNLLANIFVYLAIISHVIEKCLIESMSIKKIEQICETLAEILLFLCFPVWFSVFVKTLVLLSSESGRQ